MQNASKLLSPKKTLTLLKKKVVVCFSKPNQMHPLNVVAVVAGKDVDSFEEKNRRLCPETESSSYYCS